MSAEGLKREQCLKGVTQLGSDSGDENGYNLALRKRRKNNPALIHGFFAFSAFY